MNDDAPIQGSKGSSKALPFVAPIAGLGGFTPPPDPIAEATWRFQRDRWLAAPLAFWTAGIFVHSLEVVAIALLFWTVSYPIYAAWSLWRLRDAAPKADLWRPTALLMLGSMPFLGFIPVALARSEVGFDAMVLVTYLAGIAALIALRNGWPKTRAPTLVAFAAATAFVLSGLALTAAVGIAVAASRSQPVIYDYVFGVGGLVFALLIGLLGLGLVRAARRLSPSA